jgi:hypothetical protein
MNERNSIYVDLDIHKETIATAVAARPNRAEGDAPPSPQSIAQDPTLTVSRHIVAPAPVTARVSGWLG